MSWQEELRKLDEELAAGQISADDYRVRRDQVLSSAVSLGPDGKSAPAAAEEPTHVTPVLPQQPRPNAPARPPADGEEDADQTQIVPGDADQTQAVGGWQAARPVGPESERTQAVPGVPPQAYAGGMPPRPAPGHGPGPFPPPPGYHQGWTDETSQPWSGTDFPPLAPSSSPDWIRQGPEIFDTGDRSRTGRIALIVVGVLLVAGLAVGAVLLFNRDTTQAQPPTPQTTSETPTTTTSVRPKDDLEVADLPGRHDSTGHIKTFADVEAAGLLTPEETQVYQQTGPGKVRMVSTVMPNGAHAFVLTVAAGNPPAAAPARDSLSQLQIKYGMQAYPDAPDGVSAASVGAKPGGPPATIRAHYVHKGTIVRIQVHGDSQDQVSGAFRDVALLQVDALTVDQ